MVVSFTSAYHAILEWPTYAKFMARLGYVYLKLKMPSPNRFNFNIGFVACFITNLFHKRAQPIAQQWRRSKIEIKP